jgi:uncharacterized membrane protein (GlpM family)
MKTKPIYMNYEREIYMSEYVTIPKTRLRRLIITEVVAWGISAFVLLVTLIR